jgi:hypothetical protein
VNPVPTWRPADNFTKPIQRAPEFFDLYQIKS